MKSLLFNILYSKEYWRTIRLYWLLKFTNYLFSFGLCDSVFVRILSYPTVSSNELVETILILHQNRLCFLLATSYQRTRNFTGRGLECFMWFIKCEKIQKDLLLNAIKNKFIWNT